MAFAPDRTHGLAMLGKTARLVDLKTMRLLNTYLEAPRDIVRTWFSPTGGEALLQHPNHSLTVWRRGETHPDQFISGLDDGIFDAAISVDGSLAAIATDGGTLTIWDLESGDILHRLAEQRVARAVAFTPDGRFVLAGSRPGEPRLSMWNTETGDLVRSFTSQARDITDFDILSVAVSHDGRYVLSGGSKVILWDIESGDELRHFSFGRASQVFEVGFSEDDSQVLASAHLPEPVTSVWWTESGALQYSFLGASPFIRDLALSPQGATLMLNGAQKNYLAVVPGDTRTIGLGTRMGAIKQLEFSPDSRILVSVDTGGTHAVWDVVTGHELKSLPVGEKKITGIRFHPNRNELFFADKDGTVGLIDLDSGEPTVSFDAHPDEVTDLAVSPDAKWLATIGAEQTAKLWNTATGTLDRAIQLETSPRNVSFMPDSSGAVIASDDGMWLLNVQDGSLELLTDEPGTTGFAFRVSSDGHACTSGGRAPAAFALNYWDLEESERIQTMTGHEFGVSKCDISPDGSWLVSTSYDRTIRFWKADTGMQLPVIDPQDSVREIRYSPDGQFIAVGTPGGHFTWHLAAREEYENYVPAVDRAIDTLAENPDHVASLALLARWYAFRESWQWSAELFEEVRRGGGEIESLPLSRAYWSLGRYDDAKQEFQRAMHGHEAPAYYLRLCEQTMEIHISRERSDTTP